MKNFPSISRRDFIKLSTHTLLGLGGILGLGGLLRYFSFEPPSGPPSVYDLGDASNYPPGSRTIRSDIPAVITNRAGQIEAQSLICTHLGCTLEPDAGTGSGFLCPCHGSRFDSEGRVLEGPAQAPLNMLRVEISESNTVLVYTK